MTSVKLGDQERQALIDRLAHAWADVVCGANPEFTTERVLPEVRTLAASLVDIATSEPLDLDAAREVGAGFEAWEHLELDDLLEIQDSALAQLSALPIQTERGDLDRVRTVLALGHGFYAQRIERSKRLGMESMSRMSHDLKTPINAITGFSRVMLKGIDGPITEFQQEDLTSIYEGGRKLLMMIDDLFAVRKRDAVRSPVYGDSIEIVELLADVMRTIQPIAADSHHRTAFQLNGKLGPMTADPSMVRWVLLSLMLHAARQDHPGRLRLIAELEGPEAAARLCVCVAYEPEADEPEADESKAYEPMAYCDSEDARNEPWSEANAEWANADLALQTCQRFCDTLGGEVTKFTSRERIEFRVELPIQPPTASESPSPDRAL